MVEQAATATMQASPCWESCLDFKPAHPQTAVEFQQRLTGKTRFLKGFRVRPAKRISLPRYMTEPLLKPSNRTFWVRIWPKLCSVTSKNGTKKFSKRSKSVLQHCPTVQHKVRARPNRRKWNYIVVTGIMSMFSFHLVSMSFRHATQQCQIQLDPVVWLTCCFDHIGSDKTDVVFLTVRRFFPMNKHNSSFMPARLKWPFLLNVSMIPVLSCQMHCMFWNMNRHFTWRSDAARERKKIF